MAVSRAHRNDDSAARSARATEDEGAVGSKLDTNTPDDRRTFDDIEQGMQSGGITFERSSSPMRTYTVKIESVDVELQARTYLVPTRGGHKTDFCITKCPNSTVARLFKKEQEQVFTGISQEYYQNGAFVLKGLQAIFSESESGETGESRANKLANAFVDLPQNSIGK